jgi:4-hydroxybenzoate polyprenyltransferase
MAAKLRFFIELADIFALFLGVYYVMTGTYSSEAFWLSLPAMFMTLVLLYVHMVMDFEFDISEGKKTIANSFDSQLDSLVVLKYLLILAYLSLLIMCVFDILDWQIFIVCLTIPMAMDLYKSLFSFATDSNSLPDKKWYHFPMEGLEAFARRGEDSFMFRMLQARNLMIYFSLLYIVAIILALAC